MTQDKRTKISDIMVIVGLLIMAAMAIVQLLVNLDINVELTRWTYIAGALIVLVGRLVGIYKGPSLRIKHLHLILVFSALLYCASGSMMFLPPQLGQNFPRAKVPQSLQIIRCCPQRSQ